MTGLRVIRGGELSGSTAQTSGMQRWAAISGDLVGASGLWMGRTVVLRARGLQPVSPYRRDPGGGRA